MPNLLISNAKPALCRLCAFLPLLLLVFFIVLFTAGPTAARDRFRVEYVVDGDTCILEGGVKVRLWGIDAPELAHEIRPAQYWSEQAKQALETLVAGKEVFLERAPENHDRYGRVLGILHLPDGNVANEILLAKGAAFMYPHPPLEGKVRKLMRKYLDIQRKAITNETGMWRGVRNALLQAGSIRGNERSMRFFNNGCDGYEKIAPRNRVSYVSALEAFFAGYTPARHCGIWPEE